MCAAIFMQSSGILLAANAEWESLPLATKTTVNGKELTTAGEGSQYVMTMAYAPSNPKIAFFGTDTSGVWKSEDGGNTWKPMPKGFTSNGALSIVIDPINENIVYAAGYLGFLGREESEPYKKQVQGIYRSLNGGQDWALIRPTAFYRRPGKPTLFAFDSSSAKNGCTPVVFAAGSDDGLLRSDDGGDTWIKVRLTGEELGEIYDMKELHSGGGELVLASANGLFTVKNTKVERIGKNLPGVPYTVATSKAGPGLILVAMGKEGIYRSTDNGLTFTKAKWDIAAWRVFRVEASELTDVSISPVNANIAYARLHRLGGFGPLYSHDGGQTWHLPENTNKDGSMLDENFYFSSPFAPHPTDANVALHVSNGRARILRTEDAGKNWNYSGWGFTGGLMNDICFPAKGIMYLTLMDHGIRYSDDGKYFTSIPTDFMFNAKTCGAIAIKDNLILVSLGHWNQRGIAFSANGGKRWSYNRDIATGRGKAFIHPDNVFMLIGQGISRTNGASWNKLGNSVTGPLTFYSAMPLGNNKYRILALGEVKEKGQLYESLDDCRTWSKVGAALPCSMKAVLEIDFSATTAYAATTWAGLQMLDIRTAQGAWQPANLPRDDSGQLHISAVAVNPNMQNEVWIGRRSPGYGKGPGVFRSNDGGKTWAHVDPGQAPLFNINKIVISPFDSSVYVGTWYGTYIMRRN